MNMTSTGFGMTVTGLNYPAVDIVLKRLYRNHNQDALFERLLIIEDEFLTIQQEQSPQT